MNTMKLPLEGEWNGNFYFLVYLCSLFSTALEESACTPFIGKMKLHWGNEQTKTMHFTLSHMHLKNKKSTPSGIYPSEINIQIYR